MTHATDGLPAREVLVQLDRIADELGDRFQGTFGRETVERFVDETYRLLERSATVKVHLPTLTARFTRERLLDLAKADGLTQVTAPQVLFVCVHNAGRSQMAAALLTHHAFGHVMVRSAGSRPSGTIPQVVTDALGEIGIEPAGAFPKPLTDEVVRAADVVVTMGCGDACPVYPGKRYLDWDVPDPIGRPLGAVRSIRDEIDRRVRRLLEELKG
ncbi:low molecular weight phosphatase family protein [Amycolatopsis sp. EV170708-02-1]|uniref:arsenate-mycothiol transferase ArsC n=1 Tax=Amycolatopsis sp. EV170708-02-1 TaxID=2919322 RepID=UPI001F0C3993|nr:arsenate reductase ArsC [Amycolatopsis sp. EV170708-02-1]UMP07301.1 arsenate reductase ArsC [Amycolatopsis sp. EV170708-02-1]